MYVFKKEKERLRPFSFVKAKTKERKKAFSCESTADPYLCGKASFHNQDEWVREIEEHEDAKEARLQHRRYPPAPNC